MTSPAIAGQTRHPNVLARLQALFPTSPNPSSPTLAHNLKIRMVTWNMHDSLPKGDLTELLGRIPPYRPQVFESQMPQFLMEDQHPYHLVVVAGQECPSLLEITQGIPMGFGAGFKLIDRDSDRDSSRYSSDAREAFPHDGLGWTAMIENWLCHGKRQATNTQTTTSDRQGPYQLLVKERLMGLYLAIFVHRDLRPFVSGTSRSVVTTGLMGGRVGNKGGVGISLNIDGTTLLFINAHLAGGQVDHLSFSVLNLHLAHEGKVQHRLADFAKIQTGLQVDDFLSPEDPRVMAEDLADKFDYAFLLGDLNFRLDISRLHADWLISRQDYAQALTFDQLRNLMQRGEFAGWNEEPIQFPPTFKYDVLRTLKHRRRPSKHDQWRNTRESARQLTEVNERGDEEGRDSDDVDAASVSSSTWNSMHSRPGTEPDDDYFHPSPSSHAVSSLSSPGSRVSLSQKAKTKWLAMTSPSAPHSPTTWFKKKPFPSSSPVIVTAEHKQARRRRSLDTAVLPPSLKRLSSTSSSIQSDQVDQRHDDKGLYDTSHKQRVPSWCDRVMWKTSISPPDEDETFDAYSSRHRNRVGQLFANALRPLSNRTRRGSSDLSLDHSSSPTSPNAEPTASFSRLVESQGHLSPTRSEGILDRNGRIERQIATAADGIFPNLKRANSLSHNQSPPLAVRPRRATLADETAAPSLQSRVVTPSRWRFLPSFLGYHHIAQSVSSSQEPAPLTDVMPPPPRPFRRGDVVCLNYNTLDDRQMRKLEGRSLLTSSMQGFNKYYPPDFFDNIEKHSSLNSYRGKHALGDRARKLDQGILITRFELPFNIWCGTCNNHIGMGVRYNAEKKKIGNYYSTPIFSFRCKCHLCDGWFEIQTDPKNTRYVVVSGARQKEENWSPEENGGFCCPRNAQASDPLTSLEKTTDTQKGLIQVHDRLESLQEASDIYNADPFALSSRVRKHFREEKKIEQANKQADDGIRGRYGLPETLTLIADDDAAVKTAQEKWAHARRELDVSTSRSLTGVTRTRKQPSTVANLKARILGNTARIQIRQRVEQQVHVQRADNERKEQ
ncbi:Inositol polyphosphate phosphatase [Mycena indigotica]|uniref:Inositol polyphosphate phosphatase n=1 Tax=Mycena indigotica TaxID=2126181 RepID=A0A8H6T6V0_9AGAR|nr:Inositol polyphosphate phosphatase [Mycena indigotica]KAF7312158.1 Inositol polyphosphate phosphatase [Mycena indigotica]